MIEYTKAYKYADDVFKEIQDEGPYRNIYDKQYQHRRAIVEILEILADTTPSAAGAINILGATIATLIPYLGPIKLDEFLCDLNKFIHTLAEKLKPEEV